MVRRRMLLRMVLGHLRLRFLVALGVLCFGWAALTIDFLWKWHRHGDAYAQAFGSLLAFFASIITAAVTLTYLHVSRRSLAAAEAAIQLQRDQWESRLTVKPRFWMGVQSDQHHKAMNITYRRDVSDAYHKDAGRHFYDSLPWPHVAVDVWNDGERSLRIASYRLWIKDEDHLAIERPLAGFVVPPNELRAFPITEDLIALSFRQRTCNERYERPPCDETVVGLRLFYSDWRDDDHSSRDEHWLVISPLHGKPMRMEHLKRARTPAER